MTKARSVEVGNALAPAGNWPQRKRSGVWLTDENGKDILSCFCSGGTFNFGFDAPEIRAEIIALMQSHDSGIWQLPSERRNEGERNFAAILPSPDWRTYFVACAGEAFEVACKFAKRITGRKGLISATNGYYGHIGFGLAMDDPVLEPEQYGPLAGMVRKTVYGDAEDLRRKIDDTTAAVCLETIQIPGGVVVPPDGYFAEVRALCDEAGAMLIVDEVQGGFCRSGRIWAFNHDGIEPDIMVTGKGITGGFYPCGAMSYHPRYREKFFDPLPIHVASYAGNEFASQLAGSLARRYGDPALCTHVNAVGDRLFRGLLQIAERYPDILKPGIRGRGLICAVDVRDVELRDDIVATCMDVGLYLRGTRLAPHAINFQPPLVITAPEIDEVLNRFDSAVQRVRKI